MTNSSVATTNSVSELKTKIETRQARVAIIGLGYVGLPLALLYSDQKVRVTGFDIDQRKVKTLSEGGSYIVRILPSEIQQARSQGFEATADYARLTEMDAIIICVPTPLDERREPDLSYVENTGLSIYPHLQKGQLVVLESTTYPGTTEELLLPILEKSGLKCPIGAGPDA
jgi:UDP-N-acetyl-D-glucosamine dehydrogenase